MYSNLKDLIREQSAGKEMVTYALASADESHTLQAAMMAYEAGYANPILIGNADVIRGILADLGKNVPGIGIIDERGGMEATAKTAIELVNEGRAAFIDKGLMDSAVILKAMLKKDSGLNTGRFVSVITLFELHNYHKLLLVSDMGLNIRPDLNGKKEELRNLVNAAHDLGIACPKVAVLCAVEKVSPKMPETLDAAALKEMAQAGEFGECIVEGPISYDLAISKESAQIKGYSSPVAGDADCLLFPDLTSANITGKALIRAGAVKAAASTYGLRVPLAFGSRSSDTEERTRTIAFAAALSRSAAFQEKHL